YITTTRPGFFAEVVIIYSFCLKSKPYDRDLFGRFSNQCITTIRKGIFLIPGKDMAYMQPIIYRDYAVISPTLSSSSRTYHGIKTAWIRLDSDVIEGASRSRYAT